MASKKVSVTITFFHEGTIPPVYLAGSFSAWAPQEMEYTVENDQHCFTKEVELEPEASYQYKFRLGHEGNWWVLDEAAPKGMSRRFLSQLRSVLDAPGLTTLQSRASVTFDTR